MVGIVNKPDINYGIWASNGDVAVPSSEKVEIGHIVEKPKKEIVNWIENRQDQFMAYLNQVGIAEWDSKTTYKANISFVNRSGTVYKAKSQNIDKDPTLNQDIWDISWATYSDFYNLQNRIEKIETEEGYLNLYVSKENPEMFGDALAPAYYLRNDENAKIGMSLDSSGDPIITKQDGSIARFKTVGSLLEPSEDVVTMEVLLNFLQLYKIGDLYLTTNSSNPATTLGYGVWESYAEGRALVGYNGRNSLTPDWTRVPNNIFGEYSVALTAENNGEHEHRFSKNATYSTIDQAPNKTISFLAGDPSGVTTHGGDDILESANYLKTSGKGVPHNNVQPSIIVFIWRRVS